MKANTRFSVLWLFCFLIPGATCAGSCDFIERDFHKTVSQALLRPPSDEFDFLVFEAEVQELKTDFPFKNPNKMTVKIMKMLSGQWEKTHLTAQWVGNTGDRTFKDYEVGKKYQMAFEHRVEQGEDYFSQSICGTYHQELRE